MKYLPQYFMYQELVETGHQTVYTKDINKDNIDDYFHGLINIFKDSIETEFTQNMYFTVVFVDDIDIDLSITYFMFNILLWQTVTAVDGKIYSIHLYYPEDNTKKAMKEYIDNSFIDKYRTKLSLKELSNICDSVFEKFREFSQFQPWLANSLNLEDTIDLMNKYPEFYDAVHFNIDGIPLEDIKEKGMEAANTQIRYIKNEDHCLRDSFRTGEAISPKQYKEVAVNIGTKPNGQGAVFPHPIRQSFMNGGLVTYEDFCTESSVGRVAQILQKNKVGEAGAFARNLELNNQDAFLHEDPDYVCDTVNFEVVHIDSEVKLKMLDLRWYRTNPMGVDKHLIAKRDKHLIGKKIYLRSPMTCASFARGLGYCYKCYGDIAYINKEVLPGQIAAEAESSRLTQTQLSAKHILESSIKKMEWTEEFYDLFSIQYNSISLVEKVDFKNWKMIIDEDIQSTDDIDEVAYNYFINSFIVVNPEGKSYKICTKELDDIYIATGFYDFISDKNNKAVNTVDDIIYIDMEELMNFEVLFIVEVQNNELSRTLNAIGKLIDNKSVISNYDRNSLLETFINTNIDGGIIINSVHFEVLLSNQIRAYDDELDMPDWTIPEEKCQILTMDKSLMLSRSITKRLQYSKINKTMLDPNHDRITKSSIDDLFYMEQPQRFLSDELVSDDYKPVSDIETNYVEPVTFDNPKIKVGRKVKKRKITKAEARKLMQ